MQRFAILLLALLLMSASLVGVAEETAAPPTSEVRIVIDTSGSMKQTDPHNLRIPALKLLVNLLPKGTVAGVWLFDASSEVLVPPGPIDDSWKSSATQAAAKIHSRGLFTHIENALKAASEGWEKPAEGAQRNIILLTDGMVDISKNPADSAASQERLRNEVLPHLQQVGAHIHTIALSQQSDQDLMRQLALATEGWNETAASADQLQRVFVRMFNQTTPHDSVPLKDNQFRVDGDIKEFTVMAMLRPGSKPTRLIAPDGSVITQEKLLMNAKWVHEDGYDLITVPNPASGDWKLEADVDPDNQVLVVTNLKMVPVPLPSYLTPDEKATFSVQFTENDAPLAREDFLKLLTVIATVSQGEHKQELGLERDIGRPELFVNSLHEALQPGEYTLDIRANGKTFEREYNQTFKVLEAPIKVSTETVGEGESSQFMVTLTPDAKAIDLESVSIHARLSDAHGQTVEAEATRNGEVWQLALNPPKAGEKIVVNFSPVAKSPDGKPLTIDLKPLTVGEQPAEHPSEHAPEHPQEAAEPAPAAPPASPVDWVATIGIAAGINVVLGLVGFFVYRMLRKRSANAIDNLLNQLNP